MENKDDIPKELLYAILIAAALDESSEYFGQFPDWMSELDE